MAFKLRVVEGILIRAKAESIKLSANVPNGPITLKQISTIEAKMRKGFNIFDNIIMMMTTAPTDVLHERVIEDRVKVDLYTPEKLNDKAILFIHGG